MGQPVARVLCPQHKENTPSCMVYADGSAYCFGCGSYFKNFTAPIAVKKVEPEDVDKTIKYIKTLPEIDHRGLRFPYDNQGYYIVWPDSAYYKRRNWVNSDMGSKYTNPKHVAQPWLLDIRANDKQIVLIEGEINALSFRSVYDADYSVVSPGSAGQFSLNKCPFTLTEFKKYTRVLIIVDNDSAGIKASQKIKNELIQYNPNIQIIRCNADLNEMLTEYGYKKFKEKLKKMGV